MPIIATLPCSYRSSQCFAQILIMELVMPINAISVNPFRIFLLQLLLPAARFNGSCPVWRFYCCCRWWTERAIRRVLWCCCCSSIRFSVRFYACPSIGLVYCPSAPFICLCVVDCPARWLWPPLHWRCCYCRPGSDRKKRGKRNVVKNDERGRRRFKAVHHWSNFYSCPILYIHMYIYYACL